jgi:PTH2 family peptidyl-tRNA hydrolase
MRRGKQIAQGAHASLAFLTRRIQQCADGVRMPDQHQKYGDFDVWSYLGITPAMRSWIYGSFAKVCCRVDSEAELQDIYQKAKDAGLEVHLITDSGKTEFHGEPTNTCLAIGPDESEKIDAITGHLKLY